MRVSGWLQPKAGNRCQRLSLLARKPRSVENDEAETVNGNDTWDIREVLSTLNINFPASEHRVGATRSINHE